MGSNVRINMVRKLLRDTPEGLTVAQIAEVVQTDNTHVYRIMPKMVDAYIDRWLKTGKRLTAVWCVVVPPPHCPKPERKKK
jgi:predicted Zn-ribbon and HTH transcriptional regulator